MGSGRLVGQQGFCGNWGSLFCGCVFACKWSRFRFAGNAVLESDAHHPGRRKRYARTGGRGGGGDTFAAAGFAGLRWAERLRRLEGDEAAATIPRELWISRIYRRAPVPRTEVAA